MTSEYRYQELENWLLRGISEHRWRLGERLPSIRTLCVERNLSKATVQHALQRLEAQGRVEARPKIGYFVTLPPAHVKKSLNVSQVEAPRPVTVSDLFLDIMKRSATFDLLPNLSSGRLPPGIVSLNRSIGRALRRQQGEHHQYYDAPAGVPRFLEQVASNYAKRGWAARPEQLCATSGCQHALFLALMACCNRNDVVAVESPGFYGALQLLEQLGLRVIEVPSSIETGMNIDALEEALKRWEIKACIVSPAYATPGGALMPMNAKKRLIELAERHDLAVIEDDIYADTALNGTPDPLKGMDPNERVILCSSFSKSVSRDLRLGWVSGGRWHDRIVHLKLVTQLATSRYLQEGMAEYMADGSLGSHLRRQRNELRINRDCLIASLQTWPCEARISSPQGGLAIWVELPEYVDTLSAYLPALDNGIVMTPGPLFSISDQFRNCLRISYAHPWNSARLEALAKLRDLLL